MKIESIESATGDCSPAPLNDRPTSLRGRLRAALIGRSGALSISRHLAVLLAVAWTGLASVSADEDFPATTLEVITHEGTGTATDDTARMMMLRARRELGQDMVVVSKRGANAVNALQYFKSRPADGHTLLTYTTDHLIALARAGDKTAIEHFRPIARGTNDPQIFMVNCRAGRFNDAQALVNAMKTDTLRVGTANLGGIDHITAHLFAKRGKLQQPEIVAFSGSDEVATQLVAGAVDVGVLTLPVAESAIAAGDICPLIIAGDSSIESIPDAVLTQHFDIDLVLSAARGFVTHAQVPDAVAAQLEAALLVAMNHPAYIGFLTSLGQDHSAVASASVWGTQMRQLLDEINLAVESMENTRQSP